MGVAKTGFKEDELIHMIDVRLPLLIYLYFPYILTRPLPFQISRAFNDYLLKAFDHTWLLTPYLSGPMTRATPRTPFDICMGKFGVANDAATAFLMESYKRVGFVQGDRGVNNVSPIQSDPMIFILSVGILRWTLMTWWMFVVHLQ